jgi:hypothetical protein
MLSVLRNEGNAMDVRLDAANKAAPYVHPRLAAIDHSGTLNLTSHEEALDELDATGTGDTPSAA